MAIAFLAGHIYGGRRKRRKFIKKFEAAAQAFSRELQRMIEEAATAKDPKELLSSAWAIVSTRDSMRARLSKVSDLLNSDIDRLGKALNEKDFGKGDFDENAIRAVVDVLRKTWPAKRPQFDLETRRLLTELGLAELFDQSEGEARG